jgi:SAM-dependent methyltransferase
MRPGLFGPDSFDLVCMFQVLDHLPDPLGVLKECSRVLRPGGVVLSVNHNVEAISARILKDRSPIVDIEHTYLYSPATMRRLFAAAGFHVESVKPFWSFYHLQYMIHLAPLPGSLKKGLMALASKTSLGKLRFIVPLGNLALLGRKPE